MPPPATRTNKSGDIAADSSGICLILTQAATMPVPQMQIDLHGYHPDDIDVADLIKQAWETGAAEVTLIHGHGRNRGLSPGFYNTTTGYFGLRIRRAIRGNAALKPFAKISTLDCSHNGSTTIRLQHNPNPTRSDIDLPESSIRPRHRRRR